MTSEYYTLSKRVIDAQGEVRDLVDKRNERSLGQRVGCTFSSDDNRFRRNDLNM